MLVPATVFSQGMAWEVSVVKRCNETRIPFTETMVLGGHYGGKYLPYGLPMAIVGYGWAKGNSQTVVKGLTIESGCLMAGMVMFGLKQMVRRDRPFVSYATTIDAWVNETGFSFPSGHSTGAFALAAGLVLQYPYWYVAIPSYVFAVGVGISRIYAGVHYPSDVVVGALVGTAGAFLAAWLSKQLFPNP